MNLNWIEKRQNDGQGEKQERKQTRGTSEINGQE